MRLTEAQYRNAVLALIALGAALRLLGLDWDQGQALHPDEGNLVRAALELSVPDRMIPGFHAYNDLALWLPRLVALPLCTGGDAACLTWAARLVSALFSVATIPLAAGVARLLGGPLAGLAAGLAFACAAPLVQWAHFGTTESALAFLVVGLWLLSARWLAGQVTDSRMAVVSGLMLGLGFGMKTTALTFAILPLVALALAGWPDRARLRMVGLAAGVALVSGLLATPSLWAATEAWLEVMRFENAVVNGAVAVHWTEQFRGTTPGWYEMRQLWSMLAGAGLLLAGAGLFAVPVQARRLALPGLVFAVIYAAVICGWQARFVRYLAPLIPVLLVLAAVAVGRLASGKSRALTALALAGLGVIVLAGLDQTAIYLKTDPRIAAQQALRSWAAPGDVLLVEPNDVGLPGGLETLLLPLRGADAGALADPLARADWLLIASRRNWSVLPLKSANAPGACAFYAALAAGDLGYALAGRFERNGPLGRLFAPGLGAEETRAVFDRPEVLLFRNEAELGAEEIASRIAARIVAPIATLGDPVEACAPGVLAQRWRLPR